MEIMANVEQDARKTAISSFTLHFSSHRLTPFGSSKRDLYVRKSLERIAHLDGFECGLMR
jgi:L-ribulose-5-phosphate 3-epimerase UlaE